MNSVHPSDTGGTGRPIETSKHNYPTDKPDHHRQCAMCGFWFDDDVNQKGDSLLTPGISYGSPTTKTVRPPSPGVSFSETTVEPNVVAGCPFCGTFNPEGKYVGSEFGSNVDIQGL